MTFDRIEFDSAAGGGSVTVGFFAKAVVSKANPNPKGTVQICHGMAEYFGRYEEFAKVLVERGYNVCGIDMQGHGQTYLRNEKLGWPRGYFGDRKDSADCIIRDIVRMNDECRKRYGELPCFLYGHSMGSFVARVVYSEPSYANRYKGYVFASTMGFQPAAVPVGKICGIIGRGSAQKHPSVFVDRLAFGAFNRRISDPATAFDWISTDPEEVAKYINDPECGFIFTLKGFSDLFSLVGRMQSRRASKNYANAPCMLTYGEDDPVSFYGKGAHAAAVKIRSRGRDVVEKDYGHVRHEIQHEPCRYRYFSDIIDFFDECIKSTQ